MSHYTVSQAITFAKETDEYCLSWETDEREPIVILQPPWGPDPEWRCKIQCRQTPEKEFRGPFRKCPVCSGDFPKTEALFLERFLNDLKSQASEELQRSNAQVQPMDRSSIFGQDICEPGQASRTNSEWPSW